MGCDIHLFAEKKSKKTFWEWLKFWQPKKWITIDKWSPNQDYIDYPEDDNSPIEVKYGERFYNDGRNYNLFCALAGVRNYHFNNNPPCVSEPKGIPNDTCEEIANEYERWNGDGHSHSYLALAELEAFDWSDYGGTIMIFQNEVFTKMKKASQNPNDVRIVFWFGN